MKTYCVGDKILMNCYDGQILKTISAIFWRQNNEGHDAVEKLAVLAPALDWSVILFTDETWVHGSEIDKCDNDCLWSKDKANQQTK